MAEIDKSIVEEIETPETEEVDVELESDAETSVEEFGEAVNKFYDNIAEDMPNM